VVKIEKLESRVTEIFDMERHNFKGLKLHVINLLEPDFNFRVIHTIEMGKNEGTTNNGQKDGERSSYIIGAHVKVNEWLIQANRGNTSTKIHIAYKNGGFSSKLHGVISPSAPEKHKIEFDTAFKFWDMCGQLKITNHPLVSLSYTQPITPNFKYGSTITVKDEKLQYKMLMMHDDKIEKTQKAISINTGTDSNKFSMSYLQEILDDLDVVVAADYALAKSPNGTENWESSCKLGYNYTPGGRYGGSTIKGFFDSMGNIVTSFEQTLGEETSLVICGKMNVKNNVYDFGFGMNIPV